MAAQTRCEELATAAEAELDGATSPSATSSSRDAFIPDGARAGEPYGWDYNTATLTFNLVRGVAFGRGRVRLSLAVVG